MSVFLEVDTIDLFKVLDDNVFNLYAEYEKDFIYLPDSFDEVVSSGKYINGANRIDLVYQVFSEFDGLFESSFDDFYEDDIISFLWDRVEKEASLVCNGTVLSDAYQRVYQNENREEICKFYLSQFALDYLTEASPLTKMLPGSYGDMQMAMFKIISDEYGGGRLSGKHSVIFQNTLRSLNMPVDVQYYKPMVLKSVYMYMSYVNRLCDDKSMFFRFLGFLFVYEACLIYPAQQQSLLLKQVFGKRVDTEYFDLHVEIDQSHGVWVLEKMLLPSIKKYGALAAREILRGYYETTSLLNLCDLDMESSAIRRKL